MSEVLTLRETQEEALAVLKYFDSVCKKIGASYYLAYGTLLGAIRHNGFIPWDDDLDVWMKREDYNLLKSYWETHTEELKPYKCCSRENTENYPYYLTRISNGDFQYITKLKGGKNPDIGVFIDIYPLDEYGKTKKEGKRIADKIDRINKLYWVYLEKNSFTGGINGIIRFVLHYILRFAYGKNYRYKVNKRIDKLLEKLRGDSHYLGTPAWETYHKISEKELFDGVEYHDFEGESFPIPQRYHEILTELYKDYMQLPPSEKRIPHHEYIIIRKDDGTRHITTINVERGNINELW